jgi:hypothetical protein
LKAKKARKQLLMTIIRARAASAEPEMAWNCFAFGLLLE